MDIDIVLENKQNTDTPRGVVDHGVLQERPEHEEHADPRPDVDSLGVGDRGQGVLDAGLGGGHRQQGRHAQGNTGGHLKCHPILLYCADNLIDVTIMKYELHDTFDNTSYFHQK